MQVGLKSRTTLGHAASADFRHVALFAIALQAGGLPSCIGVVAGWTGKTARLPSLILILVHLAGNAFHGVVGVGVGPGQALCTDPTPNPNGAGNAVADVIDALLELAATAFAGRISQTDSIYAVLARIADADRRVDPGVADHLDLLSVDEIITRLAAAVRGAFWHAHAIGARGDRFEIGEAVAIGEDRAIERLSGLAVRELHGYPDQSRA